MSKTKMLIGELAGIVGVPASTVRYYERIGLLPEPPRDGGRRQYGEETIRRLHLIRFGKRVGFSLREMKALSRVLEGAPRPSDALRGPAVRRSGEIMAEIDRAREALELLDRVVACRCTSVESCSAVRT